MGTLEMDSQQRLDTESDEHGKKALIALLLGVSGAALHPGFLVIGTMESARQLVQTHSKWQKFTERFKK